MKITVSLIKADIGSYAGHNKVHPDFFEIANRELGNAMNKGLITDFFMPILIPGIFLYFLTM